MESPLLATWLMLWSEQEDRANGPLNQENQPVAYMSQHTALLNISDAKRQNTMVVNPLDGSSLNLSSVMNSLGCSWWLLKNGSFHLPFPQMKQTGNHQGSFSSLSTKLTSACSIHWDQKYPDKQPIQPKDHGSD